MYEMYLRLKEEDKNKLYLFKSGLFYIFLAEDAIEISKCTTLKLIEHSKDVVKCGFPDSAYDKYMSIFEHIKLDVVLVENTCVKPNKKLEEYLKMIKNIDLDTIRPIDSINILNKLKELL